MNANKKILAVTIILTFVFTACGNRDNQADAYGNFEAGEIIISAQSQGVLLYLDLDEGSEVEAGKHVGQIDSSSPSLKRNQLLAQKSVIAAKLNNIDAQLKVQHEQRNNLETEVKRVERLLSDNAATQQQYDDLAGKLRVLDSQTETIISQKSIIRGEEMVLNAQLGEVNNMLDKCRIASPVSGTVLEKYVDAGELVTPGKALFKVADLKTMELKVYVSGSQLSSIAIGDTVTVRIDSRDGNIESLKGKVSWIASQVEFTPKIIQTREERVNMVYAVKIRVENDGRLKIGMPGEVVWKREYKSGKR